MSRRIRVVRVIDRLNIGGPTHQVMLLSGALEGRGFQTVLVKGQVAPGEEEMGDVIRACKVAPVEVDGLSRAVSPLQDLKVFWTLYRLMRRVRPQVVHTHKSKAGVVGRLAAWLSGVPVTVHTFHGLMFWGYFSPWKSRLILMVERLLARRTDAVVAVGYGQRRELRGYRVAPPGRLRAIPLGLDLAPFLSRERADDGIRTEMGFEPSALLVGLVGRLVPIKRVSVFLEAAQAVVRRVPEARFVVVGDGELRQELEALARRLGLEDRVRFAGYRRDMARIYGALNLMVLSSLHEGLPVSIIEAICTGCYVVATRVGAVPDLVRNEQVGLMAPPEDAGALADAMVVALRERRCVPEQERRRAGRLYGIGRLVDDVDRLYRSLLNGGAQ